MILTELQSTRIVRTVPELTSASFLSEPLMFSNLTQGHCLVYSVIIVRIRIYINKVYRDKKIVFTLSVLSS